MNLQISYDFLVISTGQSTGFPLSLSDVKCNASMQDAINLYKAFNGEVRVDFIYFLYL